MVIGEWLARCPLIAILRGIKPEEMEGIFGGLIDVGIVIAEIPLNSPEPLKSIKRACELYGDKMLIGAGTVTRVAEVEPVADAGAKLIVTPCADAEIVLNAKRYNMIVIPGVGTATEAFNMVRAGADALKLFPADVLGIRMMTSLRAVLPQGTLLLPVGGVDVATLPAWRDAGADGYGIGSAFYRPGATGCETAEKARRMMNALRQS